MYLLVNPNGSRWWRFDYRHEGKRKTISFGTYPDTGLKLAREKRNSARDARKRYRPKRKEAGGKQPQRIPLSVLRASGL